MKQQTTLEGAIDALRKMKQEEKHDVSASSSNDLLCDKCDECGGSKTYENQVVMPLNGKNVCIDWCIHQIVSALNAAGLQTIACCCGHGNQDGRIDLEDGRVLIIKQSSEIK